MLVRGAAPSESPQETAWLHRLRPSASVVPIQATVDFAVTPKRVAATPLELSETLVRQHDKRCLSTLGAASITRRQNVLHTRPFAHRRTATLARGLSGKECDTSGSKPESWHNRMPEPGPVSLSPASGKGPFDAAYRIHRIRGIPSLEPHHSLRF